MRSDVVTCGAQCNMRLHRRQHWARPITTQRRREDGLRSLAWDLRSVRCHGLLQNGLARSGHVPLAGAIASAALVPRPNGTRRLGTRTLPPGTPPQVAFTVLNEPLPAQAFERWARLCCSCSPAPSCLRPCIYAPASAGGPKERSAYRSSWSCPRTRGVGTTPRNARPAGRSHTSSDSPGISRSILGSLVAEYVATKAEASLQVRKFFQQLTEGSKAAGTTVIPASTP